MFCKYTNLYLDRCSTITIKYTFTWLPFDVRSTFSPKSTWAFSPYSQSGTLDICRLHSCTLGKSSRSRTRRTVLYTVRSDTSGSSGKCSFRRSRIWAADKKGQSCSNCLMKPSKDSNLRFRRRISLEINPSNSFSFIRW